VAAARKERAAGLALIRAAGGVVTRAGLDGLEVVLVHRPRYEDWTLPKGKAHFGERDEDCALREVEEETGLRCELGDELPSTSYVDGKGRDKVVRYWRMRPLDGILRPQNEVDAAEWVWIATARERLSYDRDRGILDALVALLP
jgi:8-oxo-dGTP pyrophosphatase MutT (NUDIX family)